MDSQDKHDNGDSPSAGKWGRALSAGSQMVVVFLVGFFGGRWLDGVLHTTPWFTVLGILLGFVVGMISAYRLLMKP